MMDSAASRRGFMKAAVAIGGGTALSACLDRAREPIPRGDPASVPARQFAWDAYTPDDAAGNPTLPTHHVFLYLTYDGDGTPTAAERETVAAALDTVDRAFAWRNEGLLYSIGYSPAYFDRYDADLPASVDLPAPRRLQNFGQATFDTQDALLQLTSDRSVALLETEAAMFDDRERLNGLSVTDRLGDVFSVESRRTGFIRAGMPARRVAEAGDEGIAGVEDLPPDTIPDESPLFMGFMAGFRNNQASEDYVAIETGPFADGTTKHVANIRQRLSDWYGEHSFAERVADMFSPVHAEEGLVEGVGDNLGADSGIDAYADDALDHAYEYNRVGHAQKNARANRDDDGNVRLLRRHVESTDDGVVSLHFPSLQRGISAFEEVREAMNGDDLREAAAVKQRVNNGILEYIFTRRRGNFLIPPHGKRALPTPQG